MCHSTVFTIIVLVSYSTRRVASTSAGSSMITDAWTTMMTSAEPARSQVTNDHVIMQIIDDTVIPQSVTNGDTSDDVQGNAYNGFYSSTVNQNFNDMYSNSVTLLDDTTGGTKNAKKNEAHTKSPGQEGFPSKETVPPATFSPTIYVLNASYNVTESTRTTSLNISVTTELPEESSARVVPIRKNNNYQRGILDLLFPAARVKTFKSVFDTFRRIMSYTF